MSKFQWILLKYPLMVMVLTFCTLKLIIVNDIEQWQEDTPRDAARYILPDQNTTIIFPSHLLDSDVDDVLDFLCIVTSGPKKFEHRNAIRNTWGQVMMKQTDVKMKVIFLIGLTHNQELNQKIRDEAFIYKDILLENFYESYHNLTIKSMMLIKFVASASVKSKFVFKIDDDVFINVPLLAKVYKTSYFSNGINGNLFYQTKPIRWGIRFRPAVKWVCPSWMYHNYRYPDYIGGSGYFFPTGMANCLLNKALETPLIHMEDVYVTGMLAEQCGFQRNNVSGFYSRTLKPKDSKEGVITLHYVKPNEQKILLQTVSNI